MTPTLEQLALARRVPYSVRDIAEAIAAAEGRGQKRGYRAAVLTNGATPYPLLDVLRILADAADHLLKDHNCDIHGWEETHEAACAAREIIAEVVRECGADVLAEGHGEDGNTAALAAAELRGHTRAVNETAIASIHKAVDAEREAIVSWLCEWASVGRVATAEDYAEEIEAGDHHPKEQA